MLSFIESKNINWNNVQNILKSSEEQNQWSNFGPVSILLEEKIKEITKTKHSVVVCANGTVALHALIELHSYLNQRQLTWTTSSFGFPCTTMGPLKNAQVIDSDSDGMLDLALVPSCDGIIVTNSFGTAGSLKVYQDYCREHNKILIVDSATALLDDHLPNTMISFHHTKPWGFGEGGCAIVAKEHEAFFRSLLNFGLVDYAPVGNHATNGKMSDISAAFILDRLSRLDLFQAEYVDQYERIKRIAADYGFSPFGKVKSALPTNAALISDKPVREISNPYVYLKKYYKPLADTPIASSIYERILNFPCHSDVASLSDAFVRDCFQIIAKHQVKN
jgi:dTDP-4-amino-4,6-dideoxygalactose transaminase